MNEYDKSNNKMIKFTKAKIYYFSDIKLPKVFWDSTGGPFDKVPIDAWLVLYDENGISGQGPCSYKMGKQFLPQILNGQTNTYGDWFRKLYWSIRNSGFSGESAVELGRLDYVIHDIFAKMKNLPLHKYLGANRDWTLVYASGLGVNLTRQELAQEAEEYIRKGYSTIKMKVGGDFGKNIKEDIRRIELVRNTIGKNIKLAVDINQLFDSTQALEFIKNIEHNDIDWIEEPVHSYDMSELKKITSVSKIPIAMGESPRCFYPMESYVEAGIKHLQPIPSNLSSIADWVKAKELAQKNNIKLSSGGYSHMTASFIATGREEDMVEYLIPIMRPLYEIMEYALIEENERFILPNIPGSCMQPDFVALEKAGLIEYVEYFN